jgi:HEPN domain-containing protein
VNRNDFKQLAVLRLKEARALLRDGHFSGAYYLTGYVVECGLKACLAKKTRRYDFPDKKTTVDSYTHDLNKLLKLAGLETELEAEATADPAFGDNWTIVKDWTEESRYQINSRRAAKAIYSAVAGRNHGILRWIRRHW